jgi:hypothetical protein
MKTYYLVKATDSYGNYIVSELKNDNIIISDKPEILYENIKPVDLHTYTVNKIKYEDLKNHFKLSKEINTLVLDCEGCALSLIKQIIEVNKLNNIELIILELDNGGICDYNLLDEILTKNNFILHICVWYNAVYIKKERLIKYDIYYFNTDWFDGFIDIDNKKMAKRYTKNIKNIN